MHIVKNITEFEHNMITNVRMIWITDQRVVSGMESFLNYTRAISKGEIAAVRDTIRFGGKEYPAPEINAPTSNIKYYTVDLGDVGEILWSNNFTDNSILNSRLLWLEENDVRQFLDVWKTTVDKSNEK